MRAVFGTKAFGREHVARLDRIFSPALPVKNIGRTALKGPVHHFAVPVFDVHIEIHVRIHEFHFGDYAGERYGLALVKFHAESVVGQ